MVIEIVEANTYSINVKVYFSSLNNQLEKIYSIAKKARKKGFDPSLDVEIPIAKDIADRVEGLIGPKGVGNRIRELEHQGLSREQVAFKVAEEIAKEKFFHDEKEVLAEQAIRTSLAIITESITAAPLEGIAKVKIKENDDGSQYLAVYYAGPIRSAGGTAAGMSVLLADHVRRALNLDKYKPTEREVERMLEEIDLYNKVMHLQLPTTKEEQRFAAQHLSIEITGEPTESVEVSGNRDLKRVETNRLRGGACLVFNDGIVGRVKKIEKRVIRNKLVGWDWFTDLIKLHTEVNLELDEEEVEKKEKRMEEEDLFVKPDLGYIQDVIAGRPVFAHPSAKGGFRIRYGRSRTTGLAGMGIHPALMALTNDFLVCGTHVRTERPGKGAIVMPVDSIHPPIVKLKNGDVVKVNSYNKGKELLSEVQEILFLGDMLYGVGEFNQFNHDLVPSGYCEEWWSQELERKLMEFSSEEKKQLFKEKSTRFDDFVEHPLSAIPSPDEAIAISLLLDIPLHPEYTYHWNDLSISSFIKLRKYVSSHFEGKDNLLEIPLDPEIKKILEDLCIPHQVKGHTISFGEHSKPFLVSLGFRKGKLIPLEESHRSVIDLINSMGYIKLRNKCPCYTGARMGRPEKAKDRRMKPPVHLLFPIGDDGGRLRDLFVAGEKQSIKIELVQRLCPECGQVTHKVLCDNCNIQTKIIRHCRRCGLKADVDECPNCKTKLVSYTTRSFPINKEVRKAKRLASAAPPKLVKAVKKLMNKERIPESIIKGILRAKHDVYVYRDGTTRFDATDAVLTHFKPIEVGVPIPKLRELGYTVDINGQSLEADNQ
ncbi:MAG: DNA polymerase II large subunit, partial [Candidatus Heimdallarchaeaceae archaeon]